MVVRLHGLVLSAALVLSLLPTSNAQAVIPLKQSNLQSSAFDLINGVNALRASYGLPPYSISPILMFTAQNQADFMAANGIVTHSGPGGITLTERLLAAGYPLAGDLSLGGFRAENITANSGSAADAIDGWMGDAPHQNTMLSPNLTEIGAGVAMVDGRVYYVIDCALPTTSGVPSVGTQVSESGAIVPAVAAVIYPVTPSTPNANGYVIHEVRSGQTLWQIAITYSVSVADIMQSNNLVGNDIYPGEKLFIKTAPTLTPEIPTSTPMGFASLALTADATSMLQHTATIAPSQTITTTVNASTTVPSNNSQVMTVALSIMTLAILGGGLFAGLARRRDNHG